MHEHVPPYAVILKTYAWDRFIARQARRCEASAVRGDFFVSVDETGGAVGPISPHRVVRITSAELIAMGLADRFEHGSLLWWNADYAHYHFLSLHPEYEYFVFVEYDAVVHLALDRMIERMAVDSIDCVHMPIREDLGDWCWTEPHQEAYPRTEIEGSLICVSVFSRRALQTLFARRLEMARDSALTFWPSAEVFVPTEARRAGLQCASLEDFGSVTHFNWTDPVLEQHLKRTSAPAFLHPVYDSARLVQRLELRQIGARALFSRKTPSARSLARHEPRKFFWLLSKLVARRLVASLRRSGMHAIRPITGTHRRHRKSGTTSVL